MFSDMRRNEVERVKTSSGTVSAELFASIFRETLVTLKPTRRHNPKQQHRHLHRPEISELGTRDQCVSAPRLSACFPHQSSGSSTGRLEVWDFIGHVVGWGDNKCMRNFAAHGPDAMSWYRSPSHAVAWYCLYLSHI
jgi:hypothetical protein